MLGPGGPWGLVAEPKRQPFVAPRPLTGLRFLSCSQAPAWSHGPLCLWVTSLPGLDGRQSGMPEMIPGGAGPLRAEGPSTQDILKAYTWLTAPLCLLRAHRNDMETIYPFLFLGFVYSFLGPNPFVARMHFLVFFLGRMVHTVAYLGKLRAPTRSLAYTLAQLPCASMALQIVWEAARHL